MPLKYALYQKTKLIRERKSKFPVMLALVKTNEFLLGSLETQLGKLNGS
jgi:hypothetical protein